MGLVIELAIDIQRNNGVTNIKKFLINLADHHNSSYHYFMHEIEGHKSIIDSNECIHVVDFDYSTDDMKENIVKYIKLISKYKFIKIDCIYDDNGKIKIIHTSKKYRMKTARDHPNLAEPNKPIEGKLYEILKELN
jgi:hypothetical protein